MQVACVDGVEWKGHSCQVKQERLWGHKVLAGLLGEQDFWGIGSTEHTVSAKMLSKTVFPVKEGC